MMRKNNPEGTARRPHWPLYSTIFLCLLATTSVLPQEVGTKQQELSVHENCNDNTTARMQRAFAVADVAIRVSMREVRESSPLYKTWFGQWSNGNGTRVRQMLANIKSIWGVEFRCGGGCNSGRTACYAPPFAEDRPWYPNSRFYACGPWHKLPPLSVEAWSSRAGVIVHELSHFWGTDDIRYGAPSARKLARPEPERAVKNAENYEHFVSDVLVNAILIIN
jgi:peptidyl-Lys metalloendopeptidase